MKKKKILLLVDKILESHELIKKAIEKEDPKYSVSIAKITDINIFIKKGKIEFYINDKNIRDFELVIFRRISRMHVVGSLILHLEKNKIPFIDNGLKNTAIRGDKLTSLIRLSISGVNIVSSFYSSNKNIEKHISFLEKEFGYPIIAKDIHKHFLKGVFIIKNKKDFKKVKGKLIYQPFLNIDNEYRFLVIGGKVVVVHTKVLRDFSAIKVGYADLNSHEEYLDIGKVDKNIKNIAIKSAKVLGLDIAGVDILKEKGNNNFYVLEVNRGPAFSKTSNEIPLFAKFIKDKIKN